MSIEVRNISKTFGKVTVLKDVSLTVNTGELVALLGPSGSGKTTLLRVIAGMEPPDAGSGPILFDGADVSTREIGKRQVGFVFQHYALFKHMSVFENIAFGLRSKPWRARPSRADIRTKVYDLLKLIQLENLANRYPSQLSGGQRQRVALARALAVEPSVLLLDEPFGALDATVRRELRRWLRRLHDEIHVTSIFVTHDQEEALEVSDRIAVMNAGRIEQFGPPEEVYERPANAFVYRFLGSYNLFHAREEAGGHSSSPAHEPAPHAPHAPHDATVNGNGSGGQDAPPVTFVRPHDVEITRDNADGVGLAAIITHVGFAGPVVNVELRRTDDGQQIDAEVAVATYRELGLKRGDRVFVSLRNQSVFPLDYSI